MDLIDFNLSPLYSCGCVRLFALAWPLCFVPKGTLWAGLCVWVFRLLLLLILPLGVGKAHKIAPQGLTSRGSDPWHAYFSACWKTSPWASLYAVAERCRSPAGTQRMARRSGAESCRELVVDGTQKRGDIFRCRPWVYTWLGGLNPLRICHPRLMTLALCRACCPFRMWKARAASLLAFNSRSCCFHSLTNCLYLFSSR